jgi:aminoglycoside 6'-N-acetyltransferase
MASIVLRPATLADVPLLQQWDEEPHVIAASGEDDVIDWPAEITETGDWAEQLIAEEDGRPVGIVQIIDPHLDPTRYWGDCGPGLRAIDIWIGSLGDLGRGLGTQMMRQAFERCFASPDVTAVLIDPLESNVAARRFYERLGFVGVGPRTFGDDHCWVYRLDRQAWVDDHAALDCP